MAAARHGSAPWLASARRSTLVLLAFLALVALTGGASRADVQSLVILRPLAVLALGFAVAGITREHFRVAPAPLILLVLLVAWVALQLVPLPPSIWTGLPGRTMFAEVYGRIGLPVGWQPISLYPTLTTNSFLALLVPLAALLLALRLPSEDRATVLKALILVGVVSAMLGLFQILGAPGNPLYLYRVTNITSPVGLFSNRNHQAVFLASLIPMMSAYLLLPRKKESNRAVRLAACGSFAVFLVPLMMATGSRAGAGAMVLSLILTAWLLPPIAQRRIAIGKRAIDIRLLVVVGLALLVVGLWLFSARTEALTRLGEESVSDNLRFATIETSRMMIGRFFPFGSGFGTFADVYQIFEPPQLVGENYLNHAHDDVLEVLLEGGAVAAALLIAALVALAVGFLRVARRPLGTNPPDLYARVAAIVLVLFPVRQRLRLSAPRPAGGDLVRGHGGVAVPGVQAVGRPSPPRRCGRAALPRGCSQAMTTDKRALITGVTGQDGAYLAQLLLDKGYEVHGLKRRSSSFNTSRIENLYEDPHVESSRFHLHYGDLTDSTNLIRIVQDTQPHEIYNLAAQSHVAVSFETPEYTANADGIGTLRLLEAIRILGMQETCRFYQASTSELYGLVQETPQSETTPFYPRSPYAAAKLYAFWIVVNYREAYGLHASNGILFNHESPLRGETFVTRKITRAAAAIALGEQDILYLGNLDAQRDWGHAREYVRGMWLMMQQDQPDDYVLATGETTQVRTFVEWAFADAGITIEWRGQGVEEQGFDTATGRCVVQVDPRYFRPTEVELLLGDPSKAKRVLGWSHETDVRELAREMVQADLKLIRNDGGSMRSVS